MEENMVTLGTDTNTQLIQLARAASMETQLTPLILSGNYTQVASAVLKNGTDLVRELNNKRTHRQKPFAFDALIPTPLDLKDENLVWLRNLQKLFAALSVEHRLAAKRNLAATQT